VLFCAGLLEDSSLPTPHHREAASNRIACPVRPHPVLLRPVLPHQALALDLRCEVAKGYWSSAAA
jgi:hypothetical protein